MLFSENFTFKWYQIQLSANFFWAQLYFYRTIVGAAYLNGFKKLAVVMLPFQPLSVEMIIPGKKSWCYSNAIAQQQLVTKKSLTEL